MTFDLLVAAPFIAFLLSAIALATQIKPICPRASVSARRAHEEAEAKLIDYDDAFRRLRPRSSICPTGKQLTVSR